MTASWALTPRCPTSKPSLHLQLNHDSFMWKNHHLEIYTFYVDLLIVTLHPYWSTSSSPMYIMLFCSFLSVPTVFSPPALLFPSFVNTDLSPHPLRWPSTLFFVVPLNVIPTPITSDNTFVFFCLCSCPTHLCIFTFQDSIWHIVLNKHSLMPSCYCHFLCAYLSLKNTKW